jgi:Transposase DDE domain
MGIELIEQNVLLGLKTAFQVRLIAIKVPQEVEKKRRQAALDREKRKGIKYQNTYFEHLGWCIYITNIPIEKFSALNIWAIYRLQWRIEIIFKLGSRI